MTKEFDKNGVTVLKEFLTGNEVEEFRHLFEDKFSQNSKKKYFGYDELSFAPKILERIIDDRFSDTIK